MRSLLLLFPLGDLFTCPFDPVIGRLFSDRYKTLNTAPGIATERFEQHPLHPRKTFRIERPRRPRELREIRDRTGIADLAQCLDHYNLAPMLPDGDGPHAGLGRPRQMRPALTGLVPNAQRRPGQQVPLRRRNASPR